MDGLIIIFVKYYYKIKEIKVILIVILKFYVKKKILKFLKIR